MNGESCLGMTKIFVIGKRGVGKSTFIKSLYPSDFKHYDIPNEILTIGTTFIKYNYPIKPSNKNEFISFQIWFYNSEPKFKMFLSNFLTGSSEIFIMFDVSDLTSLSEVDSCMKVIRKHNKLYNNIPIMLLGNKADLTEHLEPAKVLANSIVKEYGLMGYCEISALKSMNIELTLETMAYFFLKNHYPNLVKIKGNIEELLEIGKKKRDEYLEFGQRIHRYPIIPQDYKDLESGATTRHNRCPYCHTGLGNDTFCTNCGWGRK